MEIGQSVQQLREHLQRLLRSPSDELDRGGQFLAYQIRLWWFCGRKLVKDRLLVTASALSYKTLVSVIPLFVIFFLILSAIMPGQQMQDEVKDFVFEALNLKGISTDGAAVEDDKEEGLEQGTGPLTTEADPSTAKENQTVADWITKKVADIVDKTKSQSTTTRAPITIISIALMILAGMSIFSTVEGALNHIWEVRHGRSWFARLRDFITTIVILGLLLGLATYSGHQLSGRLPTSAALKWLLDSLSHIVPLLVGWLVFFVVYKTLPNVRVQTRAALVAGLVGAILWEFGAKLGFELYLQYATGATKLYGNLALIPVFLLWVWISWVIVLFGAELAYVIQYMGDLTRDQMEREAHRRFVRADLAALAVAAVVAHRFAKGQEPPTRRQLSDDLGLSEGDVVEVAEALLAGGFLRQVASNGGAMGYLPARPLEQISLADVTAAGGAMQLATGGRGQRGAALRWADQYMQQMSENVQSALRERTLASLASRDEVFASGEASQSGL